MVYRYVAAAAVMLGACVSTASAATVTSSQENLTIAGGISGTSQTFFGADGFVYNLPAGEDIVSATVSGFYGTVDTSGAEPVDTPRSTALVDIQIGPDTSSLFDVGGCTVRGSDCNTTAGDKTFSFDIDPSNFDLLQDDDPLNDEEIAIRIIQQGGGTIRIGRITLTIETGTGSAAIPVPAALPLLLAGIGGLAFVGRRRA